MNFETDPSASLARQDARYRKVTDPAPAVFAYCLRCGDPLVRDTDSDICNGCFENRAMDEEDDHGEGCDCPECDKRVNGDVRGVCYCGEAVTRVDPNVWESRDGSERCASGRWHIARPETTE